VRRAALARGRVLPGDYVSHPPPPWLPTWHVFGVYHVCTFLGCGRRGSPSIDVDGLCERLERLELRFRFRFNSYTVVAAFPSSHARKRGLADRRGAPDVRPQHPTSPPPDGAGQLPPNFPLFYLNLHLRKAAASHKPVRMLIYMQFFRPLWDGASALSLRPCTYSLPQVLGFIYL
jgi:hypothetical protein